MSTLHQPDRSVDDDGNTPVIFMFPQALHSGSLDDQATPGVQRDLQTIVGAIERRDAVTLRVIAAGLDLFEDDGSLRALQVTLLQFANEVEPRMKQPLPTLNGEQQKLAFTIYGNISTYLESTNFQDATHIGFPILTRLEQLLSLRKQEKPNTAS